MRSLVSLMVLALAAGCAAPSAATRAPATASTEGRQCFWADSVNGYRAVSDTLVNVRVGASQVYSLELLGACPDVDWANVIGIEARGGGTICSGLDAVVVVPTSIGPRRCNVRTVRRLTPEEVAALPADAKP